MSLFSWGKLFTQTAQDTREPTTPEDKLLANMMARVKQKDLIAGLTAQYERGRALSTHDRELAYIELYFNLEHFLTESAPPTVDVRYTTERLRQELVASVALQTLAVPFRLIFVPPAEQTMYIAEVGVGYVAEHVAERVGNSKLKLIVENATTGTILRTVTVGPQTLDFLQFHRIASNFTQTNLFHAFRALYAALLEELTKAVGIDGTNAIMRGLYEHISKHYDAPIIARFLESVPDGFLDTERLAHLTRIELEQKASESLLAEKTKREETEKLLSESKRLNQALAAERDQMHTIVESLGEGLVVIDQNLQVLLVNPAALHMLELKQDEVFNHAISEFISILQNEREVIAMPDLLAASFKQGKVIAATASDNLFFRTRTGKVFPVALVATPLTATLKSGLVMVFRNISSEKQQTESQSYFIGMASSQLKDHLTPIRWFSDMLLKGTVGTLTPDQINIVRFINQSAIHVASMVNYLLQISEAEHSKLSMHMAMVDLRTVTQKVVDMLASEAKQKEVAVSISTIPETIPVIPADEVVLVQVLQNLLSNALHYSFAKGTVTIAIALGASGITYTIADTGVGVPKDQQAHVFEKFFRARNARKMVPEGSGLGLNLVKMLIEGWGGTISFVSEEGKGSTFTFTIPIKGMEEAVIPPPVARYSS